MIGDFIVAAAGLWRYWTNPFLMRSYRADWRGRNIVRSLSWQVAGLLAIPLLFSLLATCLGPKPIPKALGGSWMGMAATFLAFTHFWVVLGYAQRGRARELFARERRQGTLEMLLVSPMTRAEIILKKAAYPLFLVGGISLALLPVYILCSALGDHPSPRALFTLYLLFLMLAFRPTVQMSYSVLAHSRKQHVAFMLGCIALVCWGIAHLSRLAPRFSGWWLFSWVVGLAEWLARPVPFFGFHVSPIVLIVLQEPLRLAMGVLVAGGELEADGRRYFRAVGRLRYWYVLLLLLAVLGLLWPHLIPTGGLAAALGFGSDSLAAFAWLVGALLLALAGTECLETGYTRLDSLNPLGIEVTFGGGVTGHLLGGVVHALSAGVLLPLVFALCILLGGGSPFSPGGQSLWPVEAVVCSGIYLCYALGLLMWFGLSQRPALHGTAYLAALAGLISLRFLAAYVPQPVGDLVAAVSPVTGMEALSGVTLSLPDAGSTPLSVPWAVCAGLQWLIGSLVMCGNWAILRHRAQAQAYGRVAAAEVTPALVSEPVGGFARQLLDWCDRRFDNPVTTLDLRLAGRAGRILSTPVLALVATLGIVLGSLGFGWNLQKLPIPFYDVSLTGWRVVLQETALALPVVVGGLLGLTGAVQGANVYVEGEQQRTFPFVLLTPLSGRRIADGKLLGMGIPLIIALAITLPFACLAGALAASPVALLALLMAYLWASTSVALGAAVGLWMAGMARAARPPTGSGLMIIVTSQLFWWWLCRICQGRLPAADVGTAGMCFGTGAAFLLSQWGIIFLAWRAAGLGLERRRELDDLGAEALAAQL